MAAADVDDSWNMDEEMEDQCNKAFFCPILHELMTDPVTLIADGHTYDREALKQWFDTGRRTSPSTGVDIESTDFIVNYAIKKAIAEFFLKYPERKRKESVEKEKMAKLIKARENDLKSTKIKNDKIKQNLFKANREKERLKKQMMRDKKKQKEKEQMPKKREMSAINKIKKVLRAQLIDMGFRHSHISKAFKLQQNEDDEINMERTTELLLTENFDAMSIEELKRKSEIHDPYYCEFAVGDWIEIKLKNMNDGDKDESKENDQWLPAEIVRTEELEKNEDIKGFERNKIIWAKYQDAKTFLFQEVKLHGLSDAHRIRALGSGHLNQHSFNFEYGDNKKKDHEKNAKHPAAYINRKCLRCQGTMYLKNDKCKRCKATGIAELQCRSCGGDGLFKAALSEKHGKCKGNGCDDCEQNGLWPMKDVKCKTCKGSGIFKVKCNQCGKKQKCTHWKCVSGYFVNKVVEFRPKREEFKAFGMDPVKSMKKLKNVLRLYHATDKEQADGIKENGVVFCSGSGNGICFFTGAETAEQRVKEKGYLVIADVYVGRTRPENFSALNKMLASPNMNFKELHKMGYDSIKASWSSQDAEYVVYNWDQVWVSVVLPFSKVDWGGLKRQK